jgi:heme A synthase
MAEVHKYVGFVVVAVFTIGWVWSVVAFVRRREPGPRFWIWLVVAQVVAGLQALIGLVLLALGYRPETSLHYVYGFGPLVVLLIAHATARDLQKTKPDARPIPSWLVFAAGAFICFGLSLRALMTGLGTG